MVSGVHGHRIAKDTVTTQRPRFGKLPRAVDYSGISRSGLYKHAPHWRGLFVKDGKSTLVNFDRLDDLLDSLPKATIKPPKPAANEH
jgi:hypothetical protein